MATPFILRFKPGIQRDGTELDSDAYLQGLWCRFRLGQPRKIGGCRLITDKLNGLPRQIHCYYTGDRVIAHVGTQSGIQQVVFSLAGDLISMADRTPPGFSGGIQVGFTMDAIFDNTTAVVQLIVHAAQDMLNLPNAAQTVPFLGQIDATTPLEAFTVPVDIGGGTYTAPAIAGGIVCIQPYVFAFDINGRIMWSAPNNPLSLGLTGGSLGAGVARESAQKIVQGFPLRGGGGQAPAGVFWSLSEIITASFVGTDNGVFKFNTVSTSSSVLSSDGIIEYDGLYFWAGVDRFLVFNGTVTEVPNQFNQDFFFDNLTPGQSAKVFAFKVTRYGEIWWCGPLFGATEPNWAIIFNVRENIWYDTPLPEMGRSCGFQAQGFSLPTMGGVKPGPNGYDLWIHETGTDSLRGSVATALPSYFVTPWMGASKSDQPLDKGLDLNQIELDVVQTGDMTVQLFSTANAKAPLIEGPIVPIPLVPATKQEQLTSFTAKQQNRLIRLKIMSDVLGGSYIFGRNVGHATPADGRIIS